jgi:hypothetical protein
MKSYREAEVSVLTTTRRGPTGRSGCVYFSTEEVSMFSTATIAMLLGAAPLAAQPSNAPELGGTWALELTMVSAAKVPVLGSMDSVTVTTGRLRTVADDGDVTQLYEICDLSVVDQGAFVTSSIPQAFVDAIPARHVEPVVDATADGWRYRVDLGVSHVGYDPALSGGRPTKDARHPATRDSDGDGAPGATVVIGIPMFSDVEIHITQGAAMSLQGDWIGDDLVQGQVLVSYLEQNVVGASNRLFARSPAVEPVNEQSSFTLVRVPDDAACGELPALVRTAGSQQGPIALLER